MDEKERVSVEMIGRANVFCQRNKGDFVLPPKPTPGQVKANANALKLIGELADLQQPLADAAAEQQNSRGSARGGTTTKSVQRNGLLNELRRLNKTGGTVAAVLKRPEIMDELRLPHGNNDETLKAKGNAFAKAIEDNGLEDAFIALYHPDTFIADLRQRVIDFGNAKDERSGSVQNQVDATKALDPLIEAALLIVKQLDAIMGNFYAQEAGKSGAWATATHVEKIGPAKSSAGKPQPPAGGGGGPAVPGV